VLTENTVMLRGLGGGMEYFTNTMPSHSRSILHTRNSTAAQDVKFMYLPFFIYNLLKPFEDRKIQGKAVVENMPRDNHSNDGRNSAVDEERDQRLSIPVIETASKTNGSDRRVTFDFDNSGPNGFLNASFSPHPSNPRQIVPKRDTRLCGHVPVWCATQSTILVLYGLKLDTVKRFFRYSIKANKLFTKGTKYRDKPQKIEAKSKKSKHKKRSSDKGGAGVDGRHVYAERLIALFTKKEMCMAYSTIDSNDLNESESSGDRVYNVPIYDTPRDIPSRNVDPTDIMIHPMRC